MKRIIIALLFAISMPAFADKFINNEDGGKIVLTKEPCDMYVTSPDYVYYAYATEGSGKYHNGCWNLTATPPDASTPIGVSIDFSNDVSLEDNAPRTVVVTIAMTQFADFLIGGLPDATDKEIQVAEHADDLPPLIEDVDITVAGLDLQENEE